MKSNNLKQPPVFIKYLLPTISDLFFIVVFVGVIGLGPRLFNMDGDLGRHLTLGGYILDHFQIPTHDLFSHTMLGQPLTPHEWLSDVLFVIAYRLGGLNGVVFLSAMVISLALSISYRLAKNRTGSDLFSGAIFIVGIAATSIHWLSRPHIFTFLLLSLWVYGLEAIRTRLRFPVFVFPVIMLAWVNLHGAFIAGFVILLLYGGGYLWEKATSTGFQRDILMERKYLIVSGSSLVMTLINPVGFRIWETSIGFLRNNYLVGHTMEYLSPDFQKSYVLPFLILILLSILVIPSIRRPFSKIDFLQIAAWTGMGLISARNIPLYGLIAIPVIADGFKNRFEELSFGDRIIRYEERLKRVQEVIKGKGLLILIVGMIAVLFWKGASLDFTGRGNYFDPKVFPVQAADVLLTEASPDGNMYNYFPWGGYLLYRLWPEQLVFIDGQTDFYGEDLTREYEQVLTQTGDWQMILQKYHIERIIMPTDSSLIKTLSSSSHWKRIYQDSTATILIHEK